MISGVILRKPPDRENPLRGGPLIMYISRKQRERMPFPLFRNMMVYPLTAPIMTPLTKCFCTKGYTTRIGTVAMMTVQYLTSSRV